MSGRVLYSTRRKTQTGWNLTPPLFSHRGAQVYGEGTEREWSAGGVVEWWSSFFSQRFLGISLIGSSDLDMREWDI